MADSLSLAQARRIALAAQGFLDPRPTGVATARHLRRVLDRIGLLQIDSVNVLQRAHYLPLFSRLGPYPTALIDRAAYRSPRFLFEYWGHAASLIPVELQPLLRWRMTRDHPWKLEVRRPEILDWVRNELREKGPVTAGQIEQDAIRPTGNWGWNWSETKEALELLWTRGEVSVASRDTAWARRYDLTERVLPASVLATPTPEPADAFRELVRRAAAALGVAGEFELRDYFRISAEATKRAVRELVDEGTLLPVTVEGWPGPKFLSAGARLPRRVNVATVVSPFDPLVWERARTERLFGFHYRIEIYVPEAKRVHGYYVLPFLFGDRLAARVDLKADRQAGLLRVPAAWLEPGESPGPVAEALAGALRELAAWLGLGGIEKPVRGDLARSLGAELRRARGTVSS
jgi:uncharacterized protein YcaQ